MTIAMVLLVEGAYHVDGKVSPIKHYVQQAIMLAGKRVDVKFAPGPRVSDAAATAPANPWGGNPSRETSGRPGTGTPTPASTDTARAPASFTDPFVERLPGVFIPHPFVGYTGVQSAYPFHHDYFGFRNDENLYFGRYDPKTRPEVLITWSGNSEAAGNNHATTVPQFLERILNKRDPKHAYKTLNLAVNGYALNDELSAYVAVAYALKPEFSITHSAITDLNYGGSLPGGFKQLGLIYTQDAYYAWVNAIYGVKLADDIKPGARQLNDDHLNDLVPGILKTYERFRSIVEGNGGQLIHGLPPINVPKKIESVYTHVWLPNMLMEVRAALPPGSFIDFTQRKDIVFHDTIHTETETAKLYAEIYADEVLRRMATTKLAAPRKGARVLP